MTGAWMPDGSAAPYRNGILNWVMAKQKDGCWLVEVVHNTDLTAALPPTPTPAADMPVKK
jgi:hypothetical protein